MSDHAAPARGDSAGDPTPFDRLLGDAVVTSTGAAFTTAFRGYDKDEVDAAMVGVNARVRAATEQVAILKQDQRRAVAAAEQSREKAARLEEELATATAQRREAVQRLKAQLEAAEQTEATVGDAVAQSRDEVERLEAELAATRARAEHAELRVDALTEELVGTEGETPNRHQFEEVLRVAEEQASVLLRNATVQGDRLLEAAREEIENRRKDARAEAEGIVAHAHHDAAQARLRIETELTAHETRIERESAHATEKVSQAEREAAAIRSEAEKGAAALRSLVARETAEMRTEAEDAVRELRVRALEFEESLTRRQDDAQQEFLVLHNQAVAHAERITQDANEQVAASLEHSQRVAAKADDFERLMRAQAAQIEAQAQVRVREQLDQARVKAQKIIDMVTTHSQAVLRDAEDRTRQLRWQQHQLTSFMAEVKELIRPDVPFAPEDAAPAGDALEGEAPADVESIEEAGPVEVAVEVADVDAELAELVEQSSGDAAGEDLERAES
ncbi:DivIVA domain-containing protein [Microbacterium sp. 2FI]|uniref:DivIVA domain-containing protein n=1 Tax=Microbacterium sp. 2FI TaxID=2502193 RepID=UPI0010F828C0|nr:DivIVA domain-containing protein [Microbacterium sp. 2FI]